MKAPNFWSHGQGDLLGPILSPFGWANSLISYIRNMSVKTWESSITIICVGNIVLGGAGKTPICLDLGKRMIGRNFKVNYLSRGYGGKYRGPHLVESLNDEALNVGDEPLLLSKVAPTWISSDKVLGAKEAIKTRANMIIMEI